MNTQLILGQMKFNKNSSIIILDVRIQEKTAVTARLVLDTGASLVVLSTRLTKAVGIDIDPKKTAQTTTATKVETIPEIIVPYMSVLGKEAKHVKAIVKDLPPQSGVDGLLGLSFLRHFKLTTDFKKGVVMLE